MRQGIKNPSAWRIYFSQRKWFLVDGGQSMDYDEHMNDCSNVNSFNKENIMAAEEEEKKLRSEEPEPEEEEEEEEEMDPKHKLIQIIVSTILLIVATVITKLNPNLAMWQKLLIFPGPHFCAGFDVLKEA